MPMTLSEEHAAGFLDFLSETQVRYGRRLTFEELMLARLAYGDGFVRASEVANRTIRAMARPAARDDGAHAGPAAGRGSDMTISCQLDARIAAVRDAGLTPVSLILSYTDHRILSYELGGPGVGYPRAHPYEQFAPSYRGLRIVRPGIAYDGAPSVGVREG